MNSYELQMLVYQLLEVEQTNMSADDILWLLETVLDLNRMLGGDLYPELYN
ncbi:hypothetical protein ES702_05224 [subsurface metagenome]